MVAQEPRHSKFASYSHALTLHGTAQCLPVTQREALGSPKVPGDGKSLELQGPLPLLLGALTSSLNYMCNCLTGKSHSTHLTGIPSTPACNFLTGIPSTPACNCLTGIPPLNHLTGAPSLPAYNRLTGDSLLSARRCPTTCHMTHTP